MLETLKSTKKSIDLLKGVKTDVWKTSSETQKILQLNLINNLKLNEIIIECYSKTCQ